MALLVSFDKAAKILARQNFGVVDNDTQGYAEDALELALQEVEQETHLITQEKDGTLPLTGANSYSLSDIDMGLLRVVQCWTSVAPVTVIRKAEFVIKYPSFASDTVGIPRYAVLWGNDSLYVWPDQADTTLNLTYYKVIDKTMGASIMSKLMMIARQFVDGRPETVGANLLAGRQALQSLNKGQTRATDQPIRLHPEERVRLVNRHKRMRRR